MVLVDPFTRHDDGRRRGEGLAFIEAVLISARDQGRWTELEP